MLTETEDEQLYDALSVHGCYLVNDPNAYAAAHFYQLLRRD